MWYKFFGLFAKVEVLVEECRSRRARRHWGADEWQPVTDENKAGMRFFRVEVVVP